MVTAMNNTVVDMTDFSYAIGRKQILRDISLAICEGERLAIVGPNGAGKTTLLKCLDRVLTGGSGSIEISGKPLESYSQKQLALLMSYVPQAAGYIPPFTVHEFVMMGRYPFLSPFSSITQQDRDAVREALRMTRTEAFADRSLHTLSGGERQTVYIAAALAQEAKVLLLDEPTTFLDPRHKADIEMLLMRANRERGVTIVAVTHDINSAALTSDRVVALKDGAVAFCGRAEEFMDGEILQSIYDKSFLFVKHPQTGTPVVFPELIP